MDYMCEGKSKGTTHQLLQSKLSSVEGFSCSRPDRLTLIVMGERGTQGPCVPRGGSGLREEAQGGWHRRSSGTSQRAGGTATGGTVPRLPMRGEITSWDLFIWLWDLRGDNHNHTEPLSNSRVLSRSGVSDSVTPRTAARQAPLSMGDSPGKSTGVGCQALLQGIFPTQGLNPSLLHCWQSLHCLNRQGSPWDF